MLWSMAMQAHLHMDAIEDLVQGLPATTGTLCTARAPQCCSGGPAAQPQGFVPSQRICQPSKKSHSWRFVPTFCHSSPVVWLETYQKSVDPSENVDCCGRRVLIKVCRKVRSWFAPLLFSVLCYCLQQATWARLMTLCCNTSTVAFQLNVTQEDSSS